MNHRSGRYWRAGAGNSPAGCPPRRRCRWLSPVLRGKPGSCISCTELRRPAGHLCEFGQSVVHLRAHLAPSVRFATRSVRLLHQLYYKKVHFAVGIVPNLETLPNAATLVTAFAVSTVRLFCPGARCCCRIWDSGYNWGSRRRRGSELSRRRWRARAPAVL